MRLRGSVAYKILSMFSRAACFSSKGHNVVGVDINTGKVNLINKGNSPIIEPGLDELIQEKSKRSWEKIASKALSEKDISLDLEDLIQSGKIEDLIQSIKFLDKTKAVSNDFLQNLKDSLQNHIDNLDQLFNAAKTLGEAPNFNLDDVLNNSLQSSSF